jgi:hypothetical protein
MHFYLIKKETVLSTPRVELIEQKIEEEIQLNVKLKNINAAHISIKLIKLKTRQPKPKIPPKNTIQYLGSFL